MLVSPSYFPQKKSPRSVDIEAQLTKARQLEQSERDGKKEEKKEDPHGVKNPHTSVEIYQSLADNENNAEAQYRLAEISLEQENSEKAFKYMMLAAKQKHRIAQYRLGEMYAHVIEKKDESEAIKWFTTAEEASPDHSCPRALLNLGVMHSMGRGTVRDTLAGAAYLLHAESSYQSHAPDPNMCFGSDSDVEAFYLKPAKVLPTALYLLSKKYFARNKEAEGIKYQNLAADAGHTFSKLALQAKEGIKQIDENDLDLLQQEANDGCPDSSFLLGQLYRGVDDYIKQDLAKAIHYLKQAHQAGHPEAKSQLDLLELIANKDSKKLNIQ